MADEQTIVLEEGLNTLNDSGISSLSEPATTEQSDTQEVNVETSKKKKLILFTSLGIVLLIIIGVVIFFLTRHKEEPKKVQHTEKSNTTQSQNVKLTPLQIEEIIQKANLLYQRGEKQQAIALYAQIESISYYNMGVAKMQEESYDEAIDAFENSLRYENYTVPASINAAVASFKLGNMGRFKTYLKQAKEHLGEYISSPLYSYYYSLIAYYEGRNIEALASINAPTSNNYYKENQAMAVRIYGVMGDDSRALHHLENIPLVENELTKGLLQARLGRYSEAQISLTNATKYGTDQLKANLALALVSMKLGNYATASKIFASWAGSYEQEVSRTYSIHVTLHPNVFLINPFQQEFFSFFKNNDLRYLGEAIYYYAPFKIAGGQAMMQSGVNAKLAPAVSNIAKGHLFASLKLFENMSKEYRGSTALRYNLGLALAQAGRLEEAYKHFFWAYQLDPRNYLAGALCILTGKITNKAEVPRITSALKRDFELPTAKNTETETARTILFLAENNWAAASRFLDVSQNDRLSYFLNSVIATKMDSSKAQFYIDQLKKTAPNDFVTKVYEIFIKDRNRSAKDFAFHAQQLLLNGDYDHESVMYGTAYAANLERNLARITGLLPTVEKRYITVLQREKAEKMLLKMRLGLIQFYEQKFSDAYVSFSDLTNNSLNADKQTLFLAALTSLALGKNSDALIFLEIIKFLYPDDREVKYGIGLLKHEARNVKDASVQYGALGDGEFASRYFDFQILE